MSVKLGTGDTKGTTYLGIAYGDGQWVVVGNTQDVAYSTDAINWTIPTDPALKMPVAGTYKFIVYGNGTFVAANTKLSTSKIVYTTKNADGTYKWNESTQTSYGWSSLTFIDGLFIGTYGSKLYYSIDGISWTMISSSFKVSTSLYAPYGIGSPALVFASSFKGVYRVNASFYWTPTKNGVTQYNTAFGVQQIIRTGNTLSFGSGLATPYGFPYSSDVRSIMVTGSYLSSSTDGLAFTKLAETTPSVSTTTGNFTANIMADDTYVFFPKPSTGTLNKVIYVESGSNQPKSMTLPISGTWIYCAYDGISKVVALSTNGKTVIFDIIK